MGEQIALFEETTFLVMVKTKPWSFTAWDGRGGEPVLGTGFTFD